MINNKLFNIWGERVHVCGVFTGFGRAGRRGQFRTLRFEDVKNFDSGDLLWGHLWIPASEFGYLIKVGDMVSFNARVSSYHHTGFGLNELGFGLDNCSHYYTESNGNGMRRCIFRKKPTMVQFQQVPMATAA